MLMFKRALLLLFIAIEIGFMVNLSGVSLIYNINFINQISANDWQRLINLSLYKTLAFKGAIKNNLPTSAKTYANVSTIMSAVTTFQSIAFISKVNKIKKI